MNQISEHANRLSRRYFFGRSASGLGVAALGSLLGNLPAKAGADSGIPQTTAKAKRVIYLFQSGAPSQMDLFDHKPAIAERYGEELPDSVRMGQRLTGMTAKQDRLCIAPTIYDFKQHGKSGAWVSNLMPHTANISDDLCFIKSMHTDAINHDPAITFLMTGSQLPGRPSMGAWLSYGLGNENQNLPAFVVMSSKGTGRPNGQPLYQRLWGSGFIPSQHQGVRFGNGSDPVHYLSNPTGLNRVDRRKWLDSLAAMNELKQQETFDPEIETRISQYEMAFRMQASVPELTDVSNEPQSTFDLYGEDAKQPGTFAANCLQARRMAERGVRYIQLFHRGWDQHVNLPKQLPGQCKDTDRASAALVTDLKQRGLLDETLVIWGGEFGRTIYCQEALSSDNYGRDHHPRCFTMWVAGGGFQPGLSYGQTDDFCYNVADKPVSVHDLHATLLHCLGFDHERMTYRHQGRDYRLTDVHGSVVQDLLA
ncbi:DUF1501 domain-containing protein [Thalassoglobus polymorphus]|uniref:Sulfatase n=1 Tax=Thalassoglobus polymorphus TaxID=2527994 RepID=A0A517QK70_9PLAN|nr:DUF1501 domain-containing protein [Thalassoglobus polymorphus]QDT32036.1 hypothetical protein Mal48_12760 [Thalassoglobus polymorphus]